MRNKGFAMLEACLAILTAGLLANLCLPFHEIGNLDYLRFGNAYLKLQSEALVAGADRTCDSEDIPQLCQVCFNGKGDVNQAQTLHFAMGGKDAEIIVELGGGRLVY